MKINTKKLKTILPSILLILVTLSAGVTGTIAWFAANSKVTASGMSIKVVNEDGDLNVAVYSGVGTMVSNNTVSVSSSGMLNSSYDYTNGYLYTIKAGKTSTDTDPYRSLGTQSEDNWRSGSYYYAVTFTYVFTYTFSTNTSDVGLFFDTSESTLTDSSTPTTSSTTNTQQGFRMALQSGTFTVDSTDTTKGTFTKATTPENIVWAPRRTDPTKCTYLHDSDTTNSLTSDVNVYYYDENSSSYSEKSNTVLTYGTSSDGTNTNVYTEKASPSSDSTASTYRRDYLGTFSKQDGNSIAVNVVCWYEGTDSSIVNDNLSTINKLSASLHFYSVRLNS